MSKLSDYSKFENLKDSDDEKDSSETNREHQHNENSLPVPPPTESSLFAITKNETNGRWVFSYKGNKVYEWEQTLDDVSVYVRPPPHVTKGNQLKIQILPQHLRVGLTGNEEWFLNEPTFGTVDVDESTWVLEDDDDEQDCKVLVIYLIKAHRGELWDKALRGNAQTAAAVMDPMATEQDKKKLLLERFQEENPGFDFRGAEFNGSVPEAREFMGGIKYN